MSPLPILFASASLGPTLLASVNVDDTDVDTDLATRCLAAAPPYHRHYTHTASGRLYAFLISEPLTLFAIADESLPVPDALLFLRRLREGILPMISKTSSSSISISPLCFQEDFAPVFRRLISPEKPPPPSPPPPSPPSDAPLNTPPERPRKGSNKWRKMLSNESESRMEIADHHNVVGNSNLSSARKVWRRHVWRVLLIDFVVCCILFAVWLSICRGFRCLAG